MSSKSTWNWLIAAAILFTFIILFERYRPHPATGPFYLLPNLDPKAVMTVQIRQAGTQIRLESTNHVWHLTEPVTYPATDKNVEDLLAGLKNLTVVHRIPEEDLRQNPKAIADYGIDPPQLTLILDSGAPILFGHRTSPGDEVFVRIPGNEGVAIVDSQILNLFPSNANAWRDVNLADTRGQAFDKIIVTNLMKSQWSFVLQRDLTNRLWSMSFPLKVRADSEKVDDALLQLDKLRVHDFVSDDPKADLEPFGLQPPALTLVLGQDSNSVFALDFGKELTNSPGLMYARRRDQNTVVTLSTNTLSPWNTANDKFRDRHLLNMLAPIDSLHIIGQDDFTLQWQTNNSWRVLPPQNFPADEILATRLARTLSELQVADFRQDSFTATDPELLRYGLKNPERRFIISWTPSLTATNPPTQLDFGTGTNGQVFARRIGENSLYSIAQSDFDTLPSASWEMRDRHVWNFGVNDVVRLIVQQNGQVREIVHNGTNGWNIAKGTNWMINDSAIEDAVRELGHLTAFSWTARGADKAAAFGIDANAYQLTIELKNGQKLTFQLGKPSPLGSAYACVTLDGEPWIFEFPPDLYPSLQYCLMIPSP